MRKKINAIDTEFLKLRKFSQNVTKTPNRKFKTETADKKLIKLILLYKEVATVSKKINPNYFRNQEYAY